MAHLILRHPAVDICNQSGNARCLKDVVSRCGELLRTARRDQVGITHIIDQWPMSGQHIQACEAKSDEYVLAANQSHLPRALKAHLVKLSVSSSRVAGMVSEEELSIVLNIGRQVGVALTPVLSAIAISDYRRDDYLRE